MELTDQPGRSMRERQAVQSGERRDRRPRERRGVAGPSAAVALALLGAGVALDRHLLGELSLAGFATASVALMLLAIPGIRGLRSKARELRAERARDRSRLVALLDGHESIRAAATAQQTADSAAKAAVGLVGARAAFLVVARDGDSELEWLARAGPEAASLSDGLRETLAELFQFLRRQDCEPIRAVQRWNPRPPWPSGHATAAVAIPGRDATSPRGALCVVHRRRDRALTGVELEALHDLAGLAAPRLGLDAQRPLAD